MCQCFYCVNGNVVTPPGVKSFEEFIDTTYVTCKLGNKTGCDYCREFGDKNKKEGEKKTCKTSTR